MKIAEQVTVSSNVDGKELPICCVDTDKREVGISFDVAWGNEKTQQIIDILNKHHVKATFFLTGGWVDQYPEDVKAIFAAGHNLGNHTQNHKNMSQLSHQEKIEELQEVHNKVKELTGYEMNLFQPPYGDYDNNVIKTAKECGYETVLWSVDSLDWKNYDANRIISTVCENENLKNGAIILMHNSTKNTVEALDCILSNLKEQGYEIVPVSELVM
jgi:polysaccharide deacetylase family sporulation protein PdaB